MLSTTTTIRLEGWEVSGQIVVNFQTNFAGIFYDNFLGEQNFQK